MIISSNPPNIATQAFFNRINMVRSTSIDNDSRLQWITFVRGFTDIFNWDDVIDVWSCRSNHNAGIGSTIFGLKLNLNGTFVGSPTWGTNGIRRSPGLNRYVALSGLDIAAYGQFTIGGVAKIDVIHPVNSHLALCDFRAAESDRSNGSSASILVYCDSSNNVTRLAAYNMSGGDNVRYRDNLGSGSSILGAGFFRFFGSLGMSSSFSKTLLINGVSVGSDGGTGTAMANGVSNSGGLLRSQFAGTGWDATLAFAFFLSKASTLTQLQQLDSLYSQTLGKNLS